MTKPPASSEERRQVTVMFCDLVGSTELSERLDPEDLSAVLEAYQKACAETVARYQATVIRFMGDGVLAAFGYPFALEDAAGRAVRAGLEIVEIVRSLDVRPDVELHTRIGISTGRTVVGHEIAEGLAHEYALIGTTPNLAARLQDLAASDTVVVSKLTRELAGRSFEYEALGRHSLKGFREPVSAWRVIGPSGLEGFEAVRRLELSPLVDRKEELETLVSVWHKARAGEGQVVIIGGDAGGGKSRLGRELRKIVESESPTLLEYYGVPYREHSTLYAVIRHLERAAGFSHDDTPDEKLDKLEAVIELATENVAEVAPLLAALLSIPAGHRYGPLNLSPELQHAQTLEVLEALVFGMARRNSLIMIVEDLQWVDPVTRELLEKLISKVHSIPVLLVVTHRPDIAPPIPARSYVKRLVLNRLEREDCETLTKSVAGGKTLPNVVLQHVLDKSDGVPLYIEELTKSVLDSGVLKEGKNHYSLAKELHDIGLPNTLQDSLMARLDRQGDVRGVVQRCSVIGRRFPYRLAAAICDLDDMALRRAFDHLAAAELVFPRGRYPDVLYEFKHALVRDAAYSSLLREHRRNLHARVARTLVQSFPKTVETESELIAQHFMEAGLENEAIPYLLSAAHRATSRAAHRQAVRYLDDALTLIARLPEGAERDALELNAQALLGVGLAAGRSYALKEVEQAYQRARDLGNDLGEDAALRFPVIRSGLVTYYLVRAQHRIADELARDFVRSAESADRDGGIRSNPEAVGYHIDSYRCLGYTRFFLGALEEARTALEKCVELFEANRGRELEFRTPENPVVAALAVMPLVLWLLGDYEEASRRHAQGIELAMATRHPFNQAFVHSWGTVYHQWRGASADSEAQARLAIQISTDHGFDLWQRAAKMHLGIAMAAQGRPVQGLALLTDTLPSLRADGVEAFGSYYRYGLASCHLAENEPGRAREAIGEAIAHANAHDEAFFAAELYRFRGELLESSGAAEEAEADFTRALEIARDQGACSLALRAGTSRHALLAAQGRAGESRTVLAELVSAFSAGTNSRDLEKARGMLEDGG